MEDSSHIIPPLPPERTINSTTTNQTAVNDDNTQEPSPHSINSPYDDPKNDIPYDDESSPKNDLPYDDESSPKNEPPSPSRQVNTAQFVGDPEPKSLALVTLTIHLLMHDINININRGTLSEFMTRMIS